MRTRRVRRYGLALAFLIGLGVAAPSSARAEECGVLCTDYGKVAEKYAKALEKGKLEKAEKILLDCCVLVIDRRDVM